MPVRKSGNARRVGTHHSSGPSEVFLRYIDAYCEWARDPGERTRHSPRNHSVALRPPRSPDTHHANFWNSFFDPEFEKLLQHQRVEFESVSPFDSKFPRIMELRTWNYWDRESLSCRVMKLDSRRSPVLALDIYCSINRDRGVPQIAGYTRRKLNEPPNTPSYLDPFDESFAHPELSSPRSRKLKPRLDTVYESVNPFDERFPALELVDIKPVSHIHRKRRHRLSHQEKRTRLIQKKMREYARETVVRKRKLRRAFRSIPEGLRFPSPGYETTFISVSPFDESFPNGLRAKQPTQRTRVQLPKPSPKPVMDIKKPQTLSVKIPSHTADPFPALTPVAAAAFAKRGFFGDLSPRNVSSPISQSRIRAPGTTSGLRHGLF